MMRRIKYIGVLFGAALMWVILNALLTTLGLGRGAASAIGFLLLFLLGPILMAIASRAGESRGDAAVPEADSSPEDNTRASMG